MATTMSVLQPMMRRAPSPGSSTTRESFALQTQAADQQEPLPADPLLLPAVQFPPVRCRAQELAATTLVHLPGCPILLMPNSTHSPGQHKASKPLLIQLFSHPENTLETAACWTAPPNWLTTTTDTLPSIPATAWALLHP